MKNLHRIVVEILESTGNGSCRKLRVGWENRINDNHRNRIWEIHWIRVVQVNTLWLVLSAS